MLPNSSAYHKIETLPYHLFGVIYNQNLSKLSTTTLLASLVDVEYLLQLNDQLPVLVRHVPAAERNE